MSGLEQADGDSECFLPRPVSSQQLAFLCVRRAPVLTSAVPLSWAAGACRPRARSDVLKAPSGGPPGGGGAAAAVQLLGRRWFGPVSVLHRVAQSHFLSCVEAQRCA